ncbi:MAG: alanine dehydrogenase [Methanobacteriota archaeon]|nr:MAG: alanine dehydrogenase [Euryarchaeota archaeon]
MPAQHAPVKTLLLTGRQVKKLLEMQDVLGAVENAFRHKGMKKVQMPPKVYLFYDRYDGDLRTMPSYVEDEDVSAVKIVNVHPRNAEEHGLRTVMGLLVLVSPHTGAPLAIMDATHITDMRTGAASAIASKYMARPEPEALAIIGAGNQAKTQMLALSTQYGRFEEVRVYDIVPEKSKKISRQFRRVYGDRLGKVRSMNSAEAAVDGADIIVTVTSSRSPIVMDDWVKQGAHINCIGADAPGKQELSPAILRRARVIVDDWEQARHSGEINVPLSRGEISASDIDGEIGEVATGQKPGRLGESDVTVFCSTGLAIQDSLTAKIVWERAVKQKVGRMVQIVL